MQCGTLLRGWEIDQVGSPWGFQFVHSQVGSPLLQLHPCIPFQDELGHPIEHAIAWCQYGTNPSAPGHRTLPVNHFDIQRRLRFAKHSSGRIARPDPGISFPKGTRQSAAGTNGSPTNEGTTHNTTNAGTDRALVKLPRPPCPAQ